MYMKLRFCHFSNANMFINGVRCLVPFNVKQFLTLEINDNHVKDVFLKKNVNLR